MFGINRILNNKTRKIQNRFFIAVIRDAKELDAFTNDVNTFLQDVSVIDQKIQFNSLTEGGQIVSVILITFEYEYSKVKHLISDLEASRAWRKLNEFTAKLKASHG